MRTRIIALAVTLPVLVATVTGSSLLGPVAATPPTAAVVVVSDEIVRTHFYDIRREVLALTRPAPWVVAAAGTTLVTVGPDVADPVNSAATVAAYPLTRLELGSRAEQDLGTVDLAPVAGTGAQIRMLDVAYLPELQPRDDDRASILLSFATNRDGCRRSIVQEILVDLTGGGRNTLGHRWFRLPCITTTTLPDGTDTGPVMHHSGGRIALARAPERDGDPRSAILLSVGDFQIIKAGAERAGPAWPLLGSVLRVPRSGRVSVVASGLRNPQGLAAARLDRRDAVVATSHGSRGGDVLVDVRTGADFGWPRESYGTVYEGNPSQHRTPHDGALPTATLPAFAWVPSIGTGEVRQVTGSAYRRWWGRTADNPNADLLVAGMAAKGLYRIRWQGGAVRYVEPISIGYRIRSMAQIPDGTLVAGTDEGSLLILTPVTQWSSSTGSYEPM